MKGDFHVRFCGNVGVKFPCVIRLGASGRQCVRTMTQKIEKTNRQWAECSIL